MRWALAFVLAALCTPLAGAAAVRSVTAPAPVLALAHDGAFVAYAAGRSARDCNRVFVWNLAMRGVTRLGRRTSCVETSTGNSISSLAAAGRRVLWLHYAGGNRRQYTLWTATTSAPRPRPLAAQEVDVDDPAPLVVGEGDDSRLGPLLPWARGRSVVAMRADGSRAFAWTAPGRVSSLAAFAGELAVASGTSITVLDARGRIVDVIRTESDVDVVRLTGNAVVYQSGRRLERTGARAGSWPLPAGARLEDAQGDRAVFVSGGRVRSLDLTTGTVRDVAAGSAARLDGSRVSVASGRVVSVR